ncbi:hypothetical protein [Myceligenerans salitolerans]|uniref:Uncharacterized protein n=1 Tax=Myceligenerans salitolerans TaxID=1230528 RepID=A0ABS3IA18_9MICO|nr:hypothetical protein [Myceligenerans salitolerans]MBO0609874.1 hypothetical protein [Myceligenerans salitolerans]
MEDVEDLVATVGGVLAGLASLVAVVVAIDQFTLRARMRRIVTWTTELLDMEKNRNRRSTLEAIRDRAAGSLVASTLVPIRHIAEGAVWLGGGAVVIVLQVTRREDMGSVLASAAVVLVAAQQGVRRAVRMYVERERIRAEYVKHAKVVPPRTDMLAKMEGGTRSEFGWAALFVAALMAVAAGVAWVLADTDNLWPLLVVVAGIGILGFALDGVRRLGRRARSIPARAETPEPSSDGAAET